MYIINKLLNHSMKTTFNFNTYRNLINNIEMLNILQYLTVSSYLYKKE